MRRPGVGPARRGGFRGIGGGASDPPFPAGSTWRLAQEGITTVSGEVASWDTTGTALRFAAPSVPERPLAVALGSFTGAQSTATQDYLISDVTFQLVKPAIIWWFGRIDTWSASERLIDFDSTPFLATFLNGATQTVRWEHGATDLNGTTAIANGNVIGVCVKLAASGGTSRLYINGVENASVAGTATAPAARVVGLGGTNTGAGKANATHGQAAVWNAFASNAAMDAFDLTALFTYEAWARARGV